MKTRFEMYSDIELFETFNKEVGNTGWTSTRATFLSELHNEFDNRGFDYSNIGDTKSLSFKNKIILDGKIINII
ncbi:hypothetical protein HUU51_00870 [Candidatus Gracilibacteria bacterium]|nr:hypothetical protein [Candidatus Gracilibacteria bacterium]